jgi:hypothetical protein
MFQCGRKLKFEELGMKDDKQKHTSGSPFSTWQDRGE